MKYKTYTVYQFRKLLIIFFAYNINYQLVNLELLQFLHLFESICIS